VARIEYVDREATFEQFKEIFEGEDVILRNVTAADLPTSFKVEPTDKDARTVSDLATYYRKRPNVFEVTAATDVIREMKGMTTFVNNGLFVFAVFLLLASCLLILNTIRTAMFARRREIEVMKLVGATNWFIRVPFMLEGLVQGILGGGLAVGFVFLARHWIDDLLNRSDSLALLQQFSISPGDVTLACLIVVGTAVLLSVLSSALATRRFLDV
ncbi:MAG TPA: permease-like cell division protein FtsX, partial [Aquihabitans sp.]|nr:permease-like cell division protein FtsX [Aquihabitans sp.]